MKEKTYKERETEKLRGKKRFIERQAEDREANKEIADFTIEMVEHPDNDSMTKRENID